MKLDKSKKYNLWFDEKNDKWVCESEDLQESGAGETFCDNPIEEDLAAVFAVADCAGYDTIILAEREGVRWIGFH